MTDLDLQIVIWQKKFALSANARKSTYIYVEIIRIEISAKLQYTILVYIQSNVFTNMIKWFFASKILEQTISVSIASKERERKKNDSWVVVSMKSAKQQ